MDRIAQQTSAIVVGTGIVGATLAYRLAVAGARVTVLDAHQPGAGASSVSFAWTNSNGKTPQEYHALNVAGMGEHLALERELSEASDCFHHSGNVEWALDDEERVRLVDKVTRLQGWSYPVELIDRSDLRALEPALVPPERATAIAYFPADGYVDVVPLIAALLGRVHRYGAAIRTATPVKAVRSRAVVLASGETLEADHVVCAAGHRSAELLASAGFRLPMAPTSGALATTSPTATQLRAMLMSSEIHLRPDGAGRVLLQDTRFDVEGEGPPPCVTPSEGAAGAGVRGAAEMLQAAQSVVVGLEGATIERVAWAVRPIPADGYPAIGPVPGCDGVYVVCTHSGVTLAPLLARVVTRELLQGERDARLEHFRPARFA